MVYVIEGELQFFEEGKIAKKGEMIFFDQDKYIRFQLDEMSQNMYNVMKTDQFFSKQNFFVFIFAMKVFNFLIHHSKNPLGKREA